MALANRHVLEAGSGADDETLKKCVSVFEETALSTLEHTPALWNAYGDMLLSHLSSTQIDASTVMGYLLQVFTRAEQEGSASSSLQCKWIDILTKSMDLKVAAEVSERALDQHPHSAPLWERYLGLVVMREGSEREGCIADAIDKAIEAISSATAEDASEILQLLLHIVMVADVKVEHASSAMESFMAKLVTESEWLKEAFLQWVMTCMDVKAARKVYTNVLRSSKCSVDIYTLCIGFEKSYGEPASASKLYEQALSLHGTTATELWLQYIADKQREGDAQEVGRLYFRAAKVLEDPSSVAKLSAAL